MFIPGSLMRHAKHYCRSETAFMDMQSLPSRVRRSTARCSKRQGRRERAKKRDENRRRVSDVVV
jgi:hypothetical protein